MGSMHVSGVSYGSMMTVTCYLHLQGLYVIFACNSSIHFGQHLNYIYDIFVF